MKNLIFKIFVFTLVLLMSNCKDSENRKVDILVNKFPNESSVSSKKIKITSVLLNIHRIRVIDNYFVIFQKRKDSLCSVFQLPDFEHLYSFGNKGNGPNEFNLNFAATYKPVSGVAGAFTIGNKMNNLQFYKISDLLKSNSTPYKIAKLPPKLNGFRALTTIGDSLIFGAPYAGNNIDIFKYSIDKQQLETYVEYPKDFPLMDAEIKRGIYACYMASKPDNSKFVRTFVNMAKIEIFDLKNKSKSPLVISYKDFPSLKDNLNLEQTSKARESGGVEKVFSWGLTANDKYIYVQVINEKYNNFTDANGPLQSFIPEIHVFDWQGNPIVKCKLDANFLRFDIDSEGNYLYTSSIFEEDIIRRYDIRNIYTN